MSATLTACSPRAAARAGPAGRRRRRPGRGSAAAARRCEGILGEPRGVFVTLTRDGALRGCIGSLVGRLPLVEAVRESGRNAAVGDPRFPPVGPGELDGLELEVSVLSPLTDVAGPEDIDVGRHGVLLTRGGRQAVFLPQVATRTGLGSRDHARPSGAEGGPARRRLAPRGGLPGLHGRCFLVVEGAPTGYFAGPRREWRGLRSNLAVLVLQGSDGDVWVCSTRSAISSSPRA